MGRNKNYKLDRNKSILSQIESIFFNISRIKSISINKFLFEKITSTHSLFRYYDPINDKFMNVPMTVNEEQEEDIIIDK